MAVGGRRDDDIFATTTATHERDGYEGEGTHLFGIDMHTHMHCTPAAPKQGTRAGSFGVTMEQTHYLPSWGRRGRVCSSPSHLISPNLISISAWKLVLSLLPECNQSVAHTAHACSQPPGGTNQHLPNTCPPAPAMPCTCRTCLPHHTTSLWPFAHDWRILQGDRIFSGRKDFTSYLCYLSKA